MRIDKEYMMYTIAFYVTLITDKNVLRRFGHNIIMKRENNETARPIYWIWTWKEEMIERDKNKWLEFGGNWEFYENVWYEVKMQYLK